MSLKEIRLNKGLKANFVANKIGYSREYYSRLENNKAKLLSKHIDKLVPILGEEVYQLRRKKGE